MQNGGIKEIIKTTREETNLCSHLYHIDRELFKIREMVRKGKEIKTDFNLHTILSSDPRPIYESDQVSYKF